MPTYLDIYVLTRHRDAETIKRFLDEYVDESAHEDMGDEEIMMLPLGRKEWGKEYLSREKHDNALLYDAEYKEQYVRPDWEPAVSLSHVVQRGLDYPRRSFTVYLRPRERRIERVMLSFTVDDLLILGISIKSNQKNGSQGRKLLKKLIEQYDCFLGMMAAEQAPPSSEQEFRSLDAQPHNMYFLEAKGLAE